MSFFKKIFLLGIFITHPFYTYAFEPVQVQLISEASHIQEGQPFWIGVYCKINIGWHIYWQNPGTSGLPTHVQWVLPEGFSHGQTYWPTPLVFKEKDQFGYGYEHEVLLMTRVVPPKHIEGTQDFNFKAVVDWLACGDTCVPGSATSELNLLNKSTPATKTEWALVFETNRMRWPYVDDAWVINASQEGETIILDVHIKSENTPELDMLYFFPVDNTIVPQAPQIFNAVKDYYTLRLNASVQDFPAKELKGILYTSKGWGKGTGLEVCVPLLQKNSMKQDTSLAQTIIQYVPENPPVVLPESEIPLRQKNETSIPVRIQMQEIHTAHALSFPIVLLFSFLGGVLINFMPCVFPVLGIKILGFIQQSKESLLSLRLHGLVFGVGVVISFWILASILFILRTSGESLGWGFQLQSPLFVFALLGLFFLMALSFLDVYSLGSSIINIGNKWGQLSNFRSSFASGVLATIVATPCSGPFVGTALGIALTEPALYSFMIFTFLGLGVATPYVFLSFMPSCLRLLPKPGDWIIHFKHFMAFPLLATVIWLLWVLCGQTSSTTLIYVLFSLLGIALAAWIYGVWVINAMLGVKKYFAFFISALLLIFSIAGGVWAIIESEAIMSGTLKKENSEYWLPYSDEKLAVLLSEKKPVFIDFTASWCLTCQVNKRAVLDRQDIMQALEDAGVVTMRADWTKQDPIIAKRLEFFGRSGVPLNVFYTSNPAQPLVIMPTILTADAILKAIDLIPNKRESEF